MVAAAALRAFVFEATNAQVTGEGSQPL